MAPTFGFDLEHFGWWQALLAWGVLAALSVAMGYSALRHLGRVRRWLALGVRCTLLLAIVLTLAGLRLTRTHRDVELVVLSDSSDSIGLFAPGVDWNANVKQFVRDLASQGGKRPGDRVGLVSFDRTASIDALPREVPAFAAPAVAQDRSATDLAAAIQMGMACLRGDAMARLLLISDGNATQGDLEMAVQLAAANRVPIDVMPLNYRVDHDIAALRLVAPAWRRSQEPFSLELVVRNTNAANVNATLIIRSADRIIRQEPVVLPPGVSNHVVPIDGQTAGGVYRFSAEVAVDRTGPVDAMLGNNRVEACTTIRDEGRVLVIEGNAEPQARLVAALGDAKIRTESISPGQLTQNKLDLLAYDAVILNNVARARISPEQDQMLAEYVHNMGGGLMVVGGPDAFGAGGWQGSRLEEVLPISLEVPARRQIGKGALALVMHSCEMPQGNYWGEVCAVKAIEALSAQDEIGVISDSTGKDWDFALQPRGDATAAIKAVKRMQLTDFGSFGDILETTYVALAKSTAMHKHVIIISDGDPTPPSDAMLAMFLKAKISISTIPVFPHGGGSGENPMAVIAKQTKGTPYAPINDDPKRIPQIFIKEATIVRRGLLQEDEKGLAVSRRPDAAGILAGMGQTPPVLGMVVTSARKTPSSPVHTPLIVSARDPGTGAVYQDPLLSYWQSGAGRVVAFTSDAGERWLAPWVSEGVFAKFWAQATRSVMRSPVSSELDVRTQRDGSVTRIEVGAHRPDGSAINNLPLRAIISGPGLTQVQRLRQTGPGQYELETETPEKGAYAVRVESGDASGLATVTGFAVPQSMEDQAQTSNAALLRSIAQRTGGRVIEKPLDVQGLDAFSRENLPKGSSPKPAFEILLGLAMGLLLLDVGIRRIVWNPADTLARILNRRKARPASSAATVDALKRVRSRSEANEAARTFDPTGLPGGEIAGAAPPPLTAPPPTPTTGPTQVEGGHTGGLLRAKQRARDAMSKRTDPKSDKLPDHPNQP